MIEDLETIPKDQFPAWMGSSSQLPLPVTRQIHSNFLLEKLDVNIIQLYIEILVFFIPDKNFNIKNLGNIFM